ncbi:MAG: protein kinase [Candidatus Promineifilaceae bacterium]|nr:protein kinase [Candidatus Promineifilaceae bacterium]
MNEQLSFGDIVRERRHFRDLTQSELARRVGCATITIRKIEAGDLRPSVQIAERLAMSLAVPLEERADFVRLARAALRDTPEPSPLPTPRPAPEEIGEEDLSGRVIRGFQLGKRIGKGDFGVVYRAVQPLVERDVAVKIILPEYADHPEFIRRFESEAQLVARLEHPYIVPLYDYWREPGVAYLVMRLIRGGSLSAELRKGPLSLEAASKLLEQIGSALHLAHRSGVIHRDLKPSNILLDDDDNAYLADLGIAKNLGDPNAEEPDDAVVGSPAYLSPEQIRAESVRPETDIYSLGLLTYELLTGRQAFKGPTPVNYLQQHLKEPIPYLSQTNPELPAGLDLVLSRATAKNPLERYPDVPSFLAGLQGALSAVDGPRPRVDLIDIDLADIDNPFKGLRAFGEADADDFFGRDTLIQELLGRMGQISESSAGVGRDLARFLAVVGPSGSGKSSVVKAGLIPALRRGALPGSERWFIVDMIPGSHPLEELEAALLRVAVEPPERLLDRLRKSERGLLRAVRELLKFAPDAELVLVIDQFEELFTLVEDEDAREHFLNSLVAAVLDPGSRLRLVITLRADFIDRPLGYVDFGELVRRQTELVLPMTPDELEQAISWPAERHGLVVEPELVGTIVRDVGDQPGILPLIQYALTELFERRQGRTLTLAAYRESGGVKGALARRAEEIYDELEPRGQSAARQLFLRLVTLGDEATRRRVLRSELEALNHAQFVAQHSPFTVVIDAYARHRLLTFDREPLTRAPTVEVAHEALLHEWGRLRGWLDESRDDVRTQRLLDAAAAEWQEAGRDSGFLLHGSRLDQFAGWAEASDLVLTADEPAFLEASLEERKTRQAEEEARRQRELEKAQRLAETEAVRADEQAEAAESLRRRAIFLAGALVMAAILSVLAIGAGRQSRLNAREAEENYQLAITREAVAISAAIQRATAQANAEQERRRADEERDAAIDARATAIAAEAEANAARVTAEEQRQIAISRELASAAVANLDKDPERSVLLAMEAFNAAHTQEA